MVGSVHDESLLESSKTSFRFGPPTIAPVNTLGFGLGLGNQDTNPSPHTTRVGLVCIEGMDALRW